MSEFMKFGKLRQRSHHIVQRPPGITHPARTTPRTPSLPRRTPQSSSPTGRLLQRDPATHPKSAKNGPYLHQQHPQRRSSPV